MTTSPLPKLPLPPAIVGAEPGSFARSTVLERLPAIASRVIAENDFPVEIVQKLEAIAAEIIAGSIRPLQDPEAPDLADWQGYIQPFLGKSWVDVPWFFAETYFYRRIMEAIAHFPYGAWRCYDPFKQQKHLGLTAAREAIERLSIQVNSYIQTSGKWDSSHLSELIYTALWGNQADLSLWPAGESDRASGKAQGASERLLVDDTAVVTKLLTANPVKRIDFVADNAGFELIADLCLIDFLLVNKITTRLYLHLKPHPIFVSDATVEDVQQTIGALLPMRHPQIQAFGSRLRDYITVGRMRLVEDYFWTSPLAGWEMPAALHQEFAQSSLTIVKGDANYRRLLGDRHWAFDTPFADIVAYFPSPVVALRTLKSEVASGLASDRLASLDREDRHWLTNGNWGIIQAELSATLPSE